jgi:STE24 endopeptidase
MNPKFPLLAALAFAVAPFAAAQTPPPAPAPPREATGGNLDPVAATRAYLARVPAEMKARSDAYFEGGYWLTLWDFLLGSAVALFMLASGLSRRMSDFARRIVPWKPLQTGVYWAEYFLLVSVVTFPLTLYAGFFRERRYGLLNQTFGPWLRERGTGFLLGLVFGGVLMMALYGVIRRTPRTWWLWGALTGIVFLIFVQFIAPVYVAPLFNKYTKLTDPAVREPILRLARSEGISVQDVYVFDASRQSNRVSANVSGLLGTERISLNDNLLRRCSLPEIQAVMGHEMGHYVLHHVYKGTLFLGVVIVIGFALVRWGFDRVASGRGAAWGISGAGDLVGLPLLVLLISVYLFLLMPVLNTYVRTEEAEADLFGINASRQPDGEAEVDLKLGEYRKLDPGPVEEFLFFDHPSGRNRILMAMKWKAENPEAAGR